MNYSQVFFRVGKFWRNDYDYIPRTGTAGSFTAAAASTMREVRDSACQGGGKGGVRIGVQSAGHGEKRDHLCVTDALQEENGRILTPDGLWFICRAIDYDPEKIGRHMLKVMARQQKMMYFKTVTRNR